MTDPAIIDGTPSADSLPRNNPLLVAMRCSSRRVFACKSLAMAWLLVLLTDFATSKTFANIMAVTDVTVIDSTRAAHLPQRTMLTTGGMVQPPSGLRIHRGAPPRVATVRARQANGKPSQPVGWYDLDPVGVVDQMQKRGCDESGFRGGVKTGYTFSSRAAEKYFSGRFIQSCGRPQWTRQRAEVLNTRPKRETLKRVEVSCGASFTQLKQGVNEIGSGFSNSPWTWLRWCCWRLAKLPMS